MDEFEEVQILDLDGQADLIQLIQPIRAFETRMQRLDGLTGRPVWDAPLVCSEVNLPDGVEFHEWAPVLRRSAWGQVSEDIFVSPPPDLNQDGTRDLVFVSRTTASLLAVSGADGEILWWFRSQDRPDWIGAAMVAEVDGDGILDLIAPFADAGLLWVEAVSGNSGQSLWRKRVERIDSIKM